MQGSNDLPRAFHKHIEALIQAVNTVECQMLQVCAPVRIFLSMMRRHHLHMGQPCTIITGSGEHTICRATENALHAPQPLHQASTCPLHPRAHGRCHRSSRGSWEKLQHETMKSTTTNSWDSINNNTPSTKSSTHTQCNGFQSKHATPNILFLYVIEKNATSPISKSQCTPDL